MAKIKVVTPDRSRCLFPEASGSGVSSRAYLDDAKDPLHLVCHALEPNAVLQVEGLPNDAVLHVIDGSLDADGTALRPGSSVIVEYGAALDVAAGAAGAEVLSFHKPHRPANARPGGHVHVLPDETVPRAYDLGTQNQMGGGLHADAACPTCTVWLHENDFHDRNGTPVPVHSHSEDEIIFVTAGEIRLGNRICGRGTALAVSAGTKYGFHAGVELSFVNFRAASPTVKTPRGVHDEAEMWIGRLGKPVYVDGNSAGHAARTRIKADAS
jgi:hypothetical protein